MWSKLQLCWINTNPSMPQFNAAATCIQESLSPQWIAKTRASSLGSCWKVQEDDVQKLLLACSLRIYSLLGMYATAVVDQNVKAPLNNMQNVIQWFALCKRLAHDRTIMLSVRERKMKGVTITLEGNGLPFCIGTVNLNMPCSHNTNSLTLFLTNSWLVWNSSLHSFQISH